MSDNWIVNNLNDAINMWNSKLMEIWTIITQSPETFKGGFVWEVMVTINGSLQAIGYALLVLFFAMSIFSNTISFKDFKNWQTAFRYFLRFVAAKTAITYCMSILTTIWDIFSGVIFRIGLVSDDVVYIGASLPAEIEDAILTVDFWGSIPLWIVTLIGSLFIWVLSIILILTVYGRFFKLYMYTAIAPLPLSAFGGDTTASVGKAFIKSYVAVCMEGAVIVLACAIYSAYITATGPGAINGDLPAVNAVWLYLGELVFNMLVLVGLVKGADRIVKEIFGL
ncbi:hypothetical protein LJC32_01095 [Oscillospiraceae bacterium OttesenSCG-928-F05]|nr:hypothetical protein [Oscillospiraceae bacterium OttesenSCG-928-F05]